MGCCGERDKAEKISSSHKWGYMNLSDFRNSGCIAPLSYGILYMSLIVSIACYVIDAFTAAQLLAFDRWSGQITPAIPFSISRWIFAGCIILSWVLLAYRWFRALRAIKSEGVAQSYLDPLAVRVQSVRMGKKGRGWRRFLVFAEMTKSKKGAEYVALFTYFSFEAWLRIIFAEGPRNVINAITLYTVANADLIPVGSHSAPTGASPIVQFFINVKILADGNHIRAAILFGMLFVVIIWAFAALSLAISCIFYIFFLWHHIPDKGLRAYCKRKVDARLQKIVDIKVQKAIDREDKERSKLDLQGRKSIADIKREPTLPVLDGDKLPIMPLARQGTQGSFDSYTSGTPRPGQEPTLPSFDSLGSKPMFAPRMASKPSLASMDSYSSNVPLMGAAGPMGDDGPRSYSPAPSYRTAQSSQSRPYTPGASMPFQGSGRTPGPPLRQNTGISNYSSDSYGQSGPLRSGTGMSNHHDGRFTPGGAPRQGTPMRDFSANGRNSPALAGRQTSFPGNGRNSPALGGRQTPAQEFEMRSQAPQNNIDRQGSGGNFRPYNPTIGSSASILSPAESFGSQQSRAFTSSPVRKFTSPPPRTYISSPSDSSLISPPVRNASPARNFSAPTRPPQGQPNNMLLPRSGTAPPISAVSSMYDESIYDSYGGDDLESAHSYFPHQAHTTGPGWR